MRTVFPYVGVRIRKRVSAFAGYGAAICSGFGHINEGAACRKVFAVMPGKKHAFPVERFSGKVKDIRIRKRGGDTCFSGCVWQGGRGKAGLSAKAGTWLSGGSRYGGRQKNGPGSEGALQRAKSRFPVICRFPDFRSHPVMSGTKRQDASGTRRLP